MRTLNLTLSFGFMKKTPNYFGFLLSQCFSTCFLNLPPLTPWSLLVRCVYKYVVFLFLHGYVFSFQQEQVSGTGKISLKKNLQRSDFPWCLCFSYPQSLLGAAHESFFFTLAGRGLALLVNLSLNLLSFSLLVTMFNTWILLKPTSPSTFL